MPQYEGDDGDERTGGNHRIYVRLELNNILDDDIGEEANENDDMTDARVCMGKADC